MTESPDEKKPTYPKPIPNNEIPFRKPRLSFSSAENRTPREYPPYKKAWRRSQPVQTDKPGVPKQFSYYLHKKPSTLMRNFSNLMADSAELPILLMETADVFKGVTRASGMNLFMVDEMNEELNLIKQDQKTQIKFKICDGTTVAAYVANNREFVMVDNLLIPDSRFPEGVSETSISIKSVLCVPVVTPDSDCLAVIELYRDASSPPFQNDDLKIVIAVTGWMGAALHQNNQRQMLQKQAELNEYLLDLTKSYVAETVQTEKLISDILGFAKITVGAEKGTFYILEREGDELVAELYDEGIEGGFHKKNLKVRFGKNRSIPGIVAETGETINIRDAYQDERFTNEVDMRTGFVTRNILCMPIMGVGGILGVVQVVNKLNGPYFNRQDENLFKTFTVYCALALHYSTLHNKMRKKELMSKSYLRILNYHLKGCPHDMLEYSQNWNRVEIPEDFEEFYWYVAPEDHPKIVQYSIYMFYILNGPNHYNHEPMLEFILSCRKAYRDIPYHNWEHVLNVTHCMFNILIRNDNYFDELERDSLLVACLCHDLDHTGVTNNFLTMTNDVLAQLYETSPMQYHHYKMTTILLEKYPILKECSAEDYKRFLLDIKKAIMAMDMTKYFKIRSKLIQNINENDEFCFDNPKHKGLLKGIMMTTCDLSGSCKPFTVAKKICDNLYAEFHNQGDREKKMGLTPLSMMDKDKEYNIPDDQVQFLSIVVMPCCELLKMILPNTEDLYNECKNLRDTWKEIIELRNQKVLREGEDVSFDLNPENLEND